MKHRITFHCLAAILVTTLISSCGDKDQETGPEPDEGPATAGVVITALDAAGETARIGIAREGIKGEAEAGKGEKVYPGDIIEADPGECGLVRLESGDRIGLNSGSAIKVISATAVTLEKGEVWIDGALTGTSTGLRVSAGDTSVGMDAAFASVRREGDAVRVSFVSGKGTVSASSGQVAVQGGQEAVIEDGQVTVHTLNNAASLFAWTEPMRLDAARTETGYLAHDSGGGLGTLSAKPPGSNKVLPFETLGQDVRIRVQDQVATTTIEQVFRNPTNQVVEGMYKFPVPPGAKLTRFDMEIGGKLMPGEVVDRGKGRKIMKKVKDEFLWKMRDPALVEWESGSTFKTRIFPIKAKEKKRIVLSYIQTLQGVKGRYRYVLPVAVAGAEAMAIPEFRVSAKIASSRGTPSVGVPFYEVTSKVEDDQAAIDLEAKDFKPPVDLVIDIEHPEGPAASLMTYGPGSELDEQDAELGKMMKQAGKDDYFMLSLTPEVTGATALTQADDWIVLVDVSQSRTAVDMQIQKGLVDALVASLSFNDRIKIMTYGTRARVLGDQWERPSFESLERIRTMLEGIEPGGATDLQNALSSAVEQVDGKRRSRIVVIGDGAPTLGEISPGVLAAHAKTLLEGKDVTLTTIGVGSSVDTLLLEKMAFETGGKHIHVSSGENLMGTALTMVATIRAPVLEDAAIAIDGIEITDVRPAELGNLSSGEEVIVTGRYTGTGTATVKITGQSSGQPFEQTHSFEVGEGSTANSFVPLIWAGRKMDALEVAGDESSVAEAVKLSRTFGMPCRHTSLIVLENQAMYSEFGVEHADRIEWEGSTSVVYEDASSGASVDADIAAMRIAKAVDDSLLGTLGSTGGSGGLDALSGVGVATDVAGIEAIDAQYDGIAKPTGVGATKSVTKVKGKAAVGSGDEVGGSGMLDQGQVTKVVRKNMHGFRNCYEKALKKNPSLEGKIVVKFTIGVNGRVSTASAKSDTLGDASLTNCVIAKVRGLVFEKPEGGSVQYVYPIVFKSTSETLTKTIQPSIGLMSSPSFVDDIPWSGPSTFTSITALPPEVDEAKAKAKIDEIAKKIEAEPLSRRHRKLMVDYLIRLGRYDEATAAVASWRQVDSANPTVLLYRGDLVRLAGDMASAVEIYSGILDLDPEDSNLADKLAAWHESRGEWAEALPFRVMLHLRAGTKSGPAVRRALVEALAGHSETAQTIASTLVEPGKDGAFKARKGVKLTKETLEALSAIMTSENLPLGFTKVQRSDADKAKLTAKLTWKGEADLDLWATTGRGKFLGGPFGQGSIDRSSSGADGELFFLQAPKTGKFRFAILCNSDDGCKDTSAEIVVTCNGQQKKIPVLLERVWGTDVAKVSITRSLFW